MHKHHYDFHKKVTEPFAVYFRLFDKDKNEKNAKLYHLPHLPSQGDIIYFEDKKYAVDATIWTITSNEVYHVNVIGYQVF